MGWSFGWNDRRSLAAEVLKGFDHKDKDGKLTGGKTAVIAHQFAGNNLWSVFEETRPDKPTSRFIVLFLIRCSPVKGGVQGEREWGYKDVSEDMGPCEVNCPKKYLDMVPPCGTAPSKDGDGSYEWSRKWRERVCEYWTQRNAKAKAKRDAKRCGYCRTRPATTYSPDGHKACEPCREEQLRAGRERQAHLNRYETLLREGQTFTTENRTDWIHHYGEKAITDIERRVQSIARA